MSSSHGAVQAAAPTCNQAQPRAGLCDTCQDAHRTALRDDQPPWAQQRGDQVQLEHACATRALGLPPDEWPGLPRLLASARAGCAFCALLRAAILSDRFHDAWETATGGSMSGADRAVVHLDISYGRKMPNPRSQDPRDSGLRYLIVKVGFDNMKSIKLYFDLEALPDHPAVAQWLALRPPSARDFRDDDIISFLTREIKSLSCALEQDQEKKTLCFLPERLIDVGGSGLRLVERDDIHRSAAEQPQYCALSYCWGPRDDAETQTKVKTSNLEQYKVGLDFDALSPVLKDAVRVTQSLSIPYLWVDSLCILQDDISDWRRQCSQMKDIYGKARLTLITTSSRTCKEGFLSPKRHELRFPYQSARSPDVCGFFMLSFSHAYGDVSFSLSPPLVSDVDKELVFSRWARRGWTFQEESMAGARIVFGTRDVYFGTKDVYVGLKQVIFERRDEYVSRDGPVGAAVPSSVMSTHDRYALYRAWKDILRRYSAFSASSFTNPADVLPALSGLARMFGEALRADYVAGHWVDMLHHSLVWIDDSEILSPPLEDILRRRSRKPYLVPTWSGLMRGKIRYQRLGLEDAFPGFYSRSEMTVIEVATQAVGNDPYGAIQDACLILEGYALDLASLTWVEKPEGLLGSLGSAGQEICFEERAFDPISPDKGRFVVLDRTCRAEQPDTYVYLLKLDFRGEPKHRGLGGELSGLRDQFISRVTLLLVGHQERVIHGVVKDRRGYGLVLLRLDDRRASQDSYLRVGIFYPEQKRQYDLEAEECDSLPSLKSLMKKDTVRLL